MLNRVGLFKSTFVIRPQFEDEDVHVHCDMFQLYIFDTFLNFQTFLEARAFRSLPPVPPPATGLPD